MVDDLTRKRAAADQELAALDKTVTSLVAKYEGLRLAGLGQTDAVCKVGVEAHDEGSPETVAMALALAVARLAKFPGDVHG